MEEVQNFHPTVLREYDIRGIIHDTLTLGDAEILGRCFGSRIVREGGQNIVVGYDGRLSSPDLAQALIKGLLSTGLDVIDIGCGPTPMLYYAVFELNSDGGIMVTGSHNPPDYNGFKLMLGQNSFYGEQIQELGLLRAASDFVSGVGNYTKQTMGSRYLMRLLQDVDFDLLDAANMKVGWDPGNGAGGEVISELIRQLPGRHFLINGQIDGRFPSHHPDPTIPENLAQLAELIKCHGLDVGFAFDGDADRIGVMDKTGRIVWGDQLLAILARDILRQHPGATIIGDVKSSQVAFDQITTCGGKAVMWKTGHSPIKEKMRETGALLAGEMSGHIYFGHKFYGFDDAIYAALRLLNVLARAEGGLAQLLDVLPKTVTTPEIRFFCLENRKFELVDEIKERLQMTGHNVIDVDGIRVTGSDGWWLLRPSNTEAAVVVRCEANTEFGLNSIINELNQHLVLSGVEPITSFL